VLYQGRRVRRRIYRSCYQLLLHRDHTATASILVAHLTVDFHLRLDISTCLLFLLPRVMLLLLCGFFSGYRFVGVFRIYCYFSTHSSYTLLSSPLSSSPTRPSRFSGYRLVCLHTYSHRSLSRQYVVVVATVFTCPSSRGRRRSGSLRRVCPDAR
jgi:hypothetical protein